MSSLLCSAAHDGDADNAAALLNKGVDPNEVDQVEAKTTKMTKSAKQANTQNKTKTNNNQIQSGYSALFICLLKGHIDVAKLLLSSGADALFAASQAITVKQPNIAKQILVCI
jgi:ankyrin repeat protein